MISNEYRETIKQHHAKSKSWGTSAGKYRDAVEKLFNEHEIVDMLDYGCGKGELGKAIFKDPYMGDVNDQTWFAEYDPAIPGKDKEPDGEYELVTCIDVLEHVEPECLNEVLQHLKDLIGKIGYFVVSTREASHILPDGRNAHLIVKKWPWWYDRIAEHFEVFVNDVDHKRSEVTFLVSSNDYNDYNIKLPKVSHMRKTNKRLWVG